MGFFRRHREDSRETDGAPAEETPDEASAESRIAQLDRIQTVTLTAIQDLADAAERDSVENTQRYQGTTPEEWLNANDEARGVLGGVFDFTANIIDQLRSGVDHPREGALGPDIDVSADEEHWRKTLSILRDVIEGIGAQAEQIADTMARLPESGDVDDWHGAVVGFVNVTTARFQELADERD